jgi:putative membrane protein
MFVDYLTLMLVDVAAGFFLLACFTALSLDNREEPKWAAPFFVVGAIAVLSGLHMIFTWPLPGAYNIAYGESSVLFGALFVGAALCLAKGWGFEPLAVFGLFAGLVAVLVGGQILAGGLTPKQPHVAGTLFILSGIAGVLALPLCLLKKVKFLRYAAALFLLLLAAGWSLIGYGAYWSHMSEGSSFGKWAPAHMQRMQEARAPKP